jgi:hypothetical protein
MMQGNQNKLDKNQNGKIDSQDFKMLRGESKEAGMGSKPSLKAKFEASMQKQYKSRPENQMEKKAPMGDKKKSTKLSMMSKLKY